MTPFATANTILYCRRWAETVAFYRDKLGLAVTLSTDWFVEFRLNDASRLSVADDTRASIKSGAGAGITIALEVADIEVAHQWAEQRGIRPTAIKTHPWNARVFYFRDPEGHRVEVWQPVAKENS